MTPEQNKRVEEIRAFDYTPSRYDTIRFLLSLIDQQAAEIEELKRDKERLDWLAALEATDSPISYEYFGDEWRFSHLDREDPIIARSPDFRQAIDSAMGSLTPE